MAQIKYNNKRVPGFLRDSSGGTVRTDNPPDAGRCPGSGTGPCHEEKDPGIQSGRDSGTGHRKEAGDSGNTGNAGEK